jgi:hypothetical protein
MLRRPPPPHAPPQLLSLGDTRRAVADADPFTSLRVQRNVTLKHFLAASRSAGKPEERHQDPDQRSLHVTTSSSTSSRATSLTATGDSSSSALTTSSHPSTGTTSLASTTDSASAATTSIGGSAKQNTDAAVLSSRQQRRQERREIVRTLAHEFSLVSSSAAHHAHCGNVLGSLFQSNIQRGESTHDAVHMPAPRSRDPSPRPPVLCRDNHSEKENHRHDVGNDDDARCGLEQPQQQQIHHQLCSARMSTRRHHNPYNMQRPTIVSHSIVLDGAMDEHALHADAAIQSRQHQATRSSLASGLKSSSSSSTAIAAAATAATQHQPRAPLPCGVEYVLLLHDPRIRALLIDYAAVHASSSAGMFHHLREQPDVQLLQQQPHLKLGGVSRDMGDTDIAAAIAVISGVRPARVVASTDFFGRAYVWLRDPDAEMDRVRRAIDNRVWLGPRFALAPPRLPHPNNNSNSDDSGDHSDFIVLSCLKHFLSGLRTDIRGGINAPRHFATCEPWVRAHAHPLGWM